VIDFVSRADGFVLGLVVFLVVLAESLIVTDLVVPGEVGLVVAGAAAAANGTSIGLVIGAAAAGAVAGDTVGYLLGRRFGTELITTRRWLRRFRPALRRAHRYFAERGIATVAAARWVGALRGVVPVVAGSARLEAPRFYVAAAPSAVAWSATMAGLGYVFGDDIADVIDRVGLLVSAAAIVVIVAVIWWGKRRRTRSAS
jgi:undecaprenyl-diphosphatase